MKNEIKTIGTVLFVQVQREPLKRGEGPDRVYDPSALERVRELHLTPDGILGVCGDGEEVMDAHHRDHPQSRFRGTNGISVGFTAHYEHMRARFGSAITDGVAGENMIVEADSAYTAEDLQGLLEFENPDGTRCTFRLNAAMAPCNEFSHFVHQADKRLPAHVLKDTLATLNGGRRGFTLLLEGASSGRVLPGAKVSLRPA